jgi:hypothetical protein
LRSQSLFGKLTTAMASSPDTRATLRGPVSLRAAETSGVEVAKRTPAAPSLPNAAIVAEPVGDAGLNSGKAVDSKPAVDNSNKGAGTSTPGNGANSPGSESASKAPENKVNPSSNESSSTAGESKAKPAPQDQSATVTPPKKKGRFHLLKKIVMPF